MISPEGPPAREVITDGNLKLCGVILLIVLAGDISKLVHGQVFVQVRSETNAVTVSKRLQDPNLVSTSSRNNSIKNKLVTDLFLLQGLPVRVYLESERLRREILELGVDEADGPAALLRSWRRGGLATLTIDSHGGNWKYNFELSCLLLAAHGQWKVCRAAE